MSTTTQTQSRWRNRAKQAPVKPLTVDGVEINKLTGFALIAILAMLCAMLYIWSRTDLRETALALSNAQTQYNTVMAEQERLRLELASLRNPQWLTVASDVLVLDASAEVVEIKVAAQP